MKHKNQEYGISIGDKPAKLSVSREYIARFMYIVAAQNQYIGQMPIVFNK